MPLDPSSSPQPRPAPRRRRPVLRALTILFITVVIALTIATLALQFVLRTELPRNLVVSSLEQATGLEVRAGGLSTYFAGRSVLRDVVFQLPLDKTPVARAPEVRIRHNRLLGLLFGGDMGLREVIAEQPTIYVYEDARGRWSLPRLISEIAGAQPGAQNTSGGSAQLPIIVIRDGAAEFSRPGRPAATLPLAFDGRPESATAWRFDLHLGDSRAQGRVTPASWSHEIDLTLAGLEPILRLWLDQPPSPATATAHWSGSVRGGFSGLLSIDQLQVATTAAAGDTAVALNDDRLLITPASLRISDPAFAQGPLTLSRGTIDAGLKSIATNHLHAEIPGLIAEIGGSWEFDTDAVSLNLAWSGTARNQAITHHGNIQAQAKVPRIGWHTVTATVHTSGQAAAQQWNARADLSVAGVSWESLDGQVTFPRLRLTSPKEPLDLSGLALSFSSRWPTATLTELVIPDARVTRAQGAIDLTTRQWTFALDADRMTIRQLGAEPVAVSFRSTGDAQSLDFSNLQISTPDARLTAAGTYVPGRPDPLQAHADVAIQLRDSTPQGTEQSLRDTPEQARKRQEQTQAAQNAAAKRTESAQTAQGPTTREPVLPAGNPPDHPAQSRPAGAIAAALEVSGDLRPTALRYSGRMQTRGVRVAQGTLDDLDIQLNGLADPDGAQASTDTFEFMGGQWRIDARYGKDPALAVVHVDCDQVLLDKFTKLVAPSLAMAGRLGAGVEIRIPSLDAARLEVDGDWRVSEFDGHEWGFQSGQGRISVHEGRVRLGKLLLARGDAQLTGSVEFQALDPRNLHIDVSSRRWPLAVEGTDISLLLDSHLQLELDTIDRTADGTVAVTADASLGVVPIGRAQAQATVAGRTIDAHTIHADLLGGTIDGHATVPIDRWETSRAVLALSNVDLSRLGILWSLATPVRGVISGTLSAAPTEDPRALGPLKVQSTLNIADGALRGMSFGDASIIAYAGPDRVMLDRSELSIAGGTLALWSRLTWHGREPFMHLSLQTDGLDLDQLVRAVEPEIGPTPGRLSGRAAFGGYVDLPHRAYGMAELRLRNSELARFPVITHLYGLLNIASDLRQPRGQGIAELRLEGDTLELGRFHYFNRGADIVGSATLKDIWAGADSPIAGVAAGALRPLRNSGLPFGAELDRILFAVFSNAASVSVGGTLGQRQVQVVPFADVQSTIARILGQQPRQ